MPCQDYQQLLLDLGWSEDARRRAREALEHLEHCDACRQAARDFDRLGAALERPQTEAEPPGGWEAFENRGIAPPRERAPRPTQHLEVGWTFRWTAGALAACVLVGLVSFGIARQMYSGSHPGPIAPPSFAGSDSPLVQSFTPTEAKEQSVAFRKVSQVFDGRTAWLLSANGNSDIGLSPVAVDDRRLLLLRLVMVAEKQVVSTADVVIVPGQTANLTVPFKGQSLHYQIGTSADEPTHLTLWAELQTPRGGETLAALATNLEVDGDRKFSAGKLVTSAGAYELRLAFSQAIVPGSTGGPR